MVERVSPGIGVATLCLLTLELLRNAITFENLQKCLLHGQGMVGSKQPFPSHVILGKI